MTLRIKNLIGDRKPVEVRIGAEDNLSVVTRKFWEQLGNAYIYTEQRLFVFKVVFNEFG